MGARPGRDGWERQGSPRAGFYLISSSASEIARAGSAFQVYITEPETVHVVTASNVSTNPIRALAAAFRSIPSMPLEVCRVRIRPIAVG